MERFKKALDPKVLERFNNEQIWTGKCRKCGEKLKGTPKELKEHRCHDTDTEPGAAPELPNEGPEPDEVERLPNGGAD